MKYGRKMEIQAGRALAGWNWYTVNGHTG